MFVHKWKPISALISSFRMVGKKLLFGQDCRLKMLQGCIKLADAVKVTLGPKGRVVLIDHLFGQPQATKDGYTVAKAIILEDRIEDMGCLITKSAAEKTNWEVGDGTTVTVLLTGVIFKEGCRAIAGGINPCILKRSIDRAADIVLQEVQSLSMPVTPELVQKVATIAANGDKNIGDMVQFIYKRVGVDGCVTVSENKKLLETEIEFSAGYRTDVGLASPHFSNSKLLSITKCELDNPLVLVVEDYLSSMKELELFMNHAKKKKRSLFILARKVDPSIITYLLANNSTKTLKVCLICMDKSFDNFTNIYEDFAAVCQAQHISNHLNFPIKNADIDCLGSARKIISTNTNTTVISEQKENKQLKYQIKRVESLLEKFEHEKSKDLTEEMRKRIGKLKGKSAVIQVGGATETERKELKDRIEDSIFSAQSALKGGVVVGGGASLLHASKKLVPYLESHCIEERMAFEIISKACRAPVQALAENAGFPGSPIAVHLLEFENPHIGFDAYNSRISDLVSNGILDATKVVCTSFRNAVSTGTMLLTTESTISFI